ncbi:hypothetical protein JCM5350_002915 [Sporobolomyces pararoseus]
MSIDSPPPPFGTNASISSSSLIQPSSLVPRPSLQRSNPSYASNTSSTSTGGGTGGSGGSTRLLWRGSIVTNKGYKLYGVAIIAHLFSVPSTKTTTNVETRSTTTTTSFSPFEDPFSSDSSSKRGDTGADMCLGLEMLRGKDLYLLDNNDDSSLEGSVLVQHVVRPTDSTPYSSPEIDRKKLTSTRKGKGKELVENESVLKVETPTDVRVYIDERCSETVEWFQDTFCRQGCQGRGIRLDAGGEQIVIFAQLPTTTKTTTDSVPSTSSTTLEETENPASSLPPLTLLLGRPFKPIVRKPRPDDPLPRESLFTAKLRKTASLPSTAFSKTSISQPQHESTTTTGTTLSKKKRSLSSKDKAIASLLGNNNTDSHTGSLRPVVPQRRQNSIPPPIISLPPPPGGINNKRSLSRSFSTSSAAIASQSHSNHRLFSSNSNSTSSFPSSSSILRRQGSLPPQSLTLEPSSSTTRAFKRSRSSLPTTSGTTYNNNNNSLFSINNSNLSPPPRFRSSRRNSHAPPSPTPSIASTSTATITTTTHRFGGVGVGVGQEDLEEEGFDFEEEQDRLEELREIGIKRQRSTNGINFSSGPVATGGGGSMKRSLSVPIGAGGKFLNVGNGGGENGNTDTKLEKGAGVVEVNPIEVRNKNTVKKLTATRLQFLGIGKDHLEFKDLFSIVTRGVGFALRSHFKLKILSKEEREKAEQLIDEHLLLYLSEEYQNILMEGSSIGDTGGGEEVKVESTETKESGKNLSFEVTEDVIDLGGGGGDSMLDIGEEGDKVAGEKETGETLLRRKNKEEDVEDDKFEIAPSQQRQGTSSDTIVGDDQETEIKNGDHLLRYGKERMVNVLGDWDSGRTETQSIVDN